MAAKKPISISWHKISDQKWENHFSEGIFRWNLAHNWRFKGTNGRQKTCEIFHVYCIFYFGFMCQTTVIFGITKDGSLESNNLASWNCFTCRNLFQNGANDMSECLTFETALCKKLKILYSSDHPILIKFRQLVVNIVIKELQMVFLTSAVINSNGNMKELERKIKCEKLMFR